MTIFLLAFLIFLSSSNLAAPGSTSAAPSRSPEESFYAHQVVQILTTLIDADKRLFDTLKNVKLGTLPFSSFHQALTDTDGVSRRLFLNYSQLPVPPRYVGVDQKMQRLGHLRSQAFDLMLSSWTDGSVLDQQKGYSQYEEALRLELELLKRIQQ
jgi:hypothetical protein